MKRAMMTAALALAAFAMTTAAEGAVKTFGNPKISGNRLDWCLNWGQQCGKPAADAYCKTLGYNDSVDLEQDPDIGATTPTRLLGTGAVCDQPICDGFTFITCEKKLVLTPIPPKPLPPPLPPAAKAEQFLKPKINGVRLDWCFAGQNGCGKKAADAFCEDQDYDEAIKFEVAPGIGPLKPTIQIGTGKVKVKPLANGFKYITCAE
jgi:hypothetical protein